MGLPSKNKKIKIDKSVNKLLLEEDNFGIKNFETYKSFEKSLSIRENTGASMKLRKRKLLVGYGAPAKATTALNFFGITKQIDYIIEDNKLKENKFIPGVKIPIISKDKIKQKPLVRLF